MKKIIVAIDGYSSTGKSTFAKLIAKEYGYKYIDTGAMYRAVTLYAMRSGMITGGVPDVKVLTANLDDINVDFDLKDNHILLNGEDVEKEIRGMDVSGNVSRVSEIPEVREKLKSLQRRMGLEKGIVMDGRDIGTTVFPDAELKIFMTASPEIRAERRCMEYRQKGMEVPFDEVRKNIEERDAMDEKRAVSPLRCAEDAVVMDNSHMTVDEQLRQVRELMAERIG